MIKSYKDKATTDFAAGKSPRKIPTNLTNVIRRKMAMLEAAEELNDLRIPPANRLEELKGNRNGQHSIRINKQWRIYFIWTDKGPSDVEIVDYH